MIKSRALCHLLQTQPPPCRIRVNANKEKEITPKIPKEGKKTISCRNYSQRGARTENAPICHCAELRQYVIHIPHGASCYNPPAGWIHPSSRVRPCGIWQQRFWSPLWGQQRRRDERPLGPSWARSRRLPKPGGLKRCPRGFPGERNALFCFMPERKLL